VQAQSHTPEPTPESTAAAERFLASLDDDLNISAAMGHLFDWLRESNKAMDLEQLSTGQAAQTLLDFEKISSILALEEDAASATTEVLSLLEERQKARSERNWARSDEIRDAIALLGWTVKDTKQGPQLVRV
jgi:cysteinyl-tRNA synthetase